MFTSVTVERLYAGSVYKLIGIGLTCSVIPLSLLVGVLALFGAGSLTWNDKPIVGLWGLALSPVFGLLLTLVLTFVLGTACVLGLWLYSKFRPLVLWGRNVLV
jgi:flagellin-like protein